MKHKILKASTIGVLMPVLSASVVLADEVADNDVNYTIQTRMTETSMNKVAVADVKKGSSLNIRDTYGMNGNIIGKIPAGKQVSILEKVNGWYKVKYNGVEGYSSASYLKITDSSQSSTTSDVEQEISLNGKVKSMSSKLNIRLKPTTSSDVIGKLNSGQVIKLVGKTSSGWYKINLNGMTGYVCGDYIQIVSNQESTSVDASVIGKIATVNATALNVRSGSGTSYSVINKIYNGNNVKILDVSANGWNKVQTSSGVTGWVSGKYLNNYRNGNLESSSQAQNNTPNVNQTSNKVANVISLAKSKLGCSYEWGAEGPNTFDCSGFTHYTFKNAAGITLPRTSSTQANAGYAVSKSNLKPGDLVFFNTNGKGISHVGIYLGNNEMIHSPNSGDVVKVTNISTNYYSSRFVTARRIVE